ncbi:rRNA maturation RNase YbeY [Candidatus Woesebacteria bacterium RIFCSPLOWO2_01_FULL_39_23]|uniref:rRNA maturation RNase YbeY n=1 Tax=Candidatus Woesebacteria bacterium RIFCSPHIGHO2_01_FULL_40_22 TaxID=1802499 RepID=A0A1F7YHV3_9BACT|nr:MAG: rRNA maturation RNase YbeY [Candidatus Woesebacteria bacterium RBG_16_40_11]OGM26934.1 MAG: rRNA maturation RNase YbeY [Candidatus Woesebacteria bacterium RIFCSPHIGHO2_01_FULL_40_22]OGM37343.1 MAG: rRNA maturation RNase YbeY [Candidatus Woesebacteria bacterium RIFCSPHIGHO2_12_FULL_38_9]OGM63208.1 MAG: rRNA maturation RNase YbeY [Candidatus Woesebacteria bacterium RIFCSPLOWO2_01_FULL_39_23]
MIRVYVKKQSNYPVNAPLLKKRITRFFEGQGIVSDSDVVIAIVGKKAMLDLAKKFLCENKVLHNVLSFTESEVNKKFIEAKKDVNHLGEIVICYPQVVVEANKEDRLIEDKVYELAEHGADHLMGKHHE